jgi:uncharacterized protein (TIGR02186 family)
MVMRLWQVLCIGILLLLPATHAAARPVIADLSLRSIAIDSGFSGTDILLFGARNDAGDIVVVVRGPEVSYIVRKKEQVAGIWVNRKHAEIHNALGFYSVGANRPLDELHNEGLLKALNIGQENIVWKADAPGDTEVKEFVDAFVQNKETKGLYQPSIKDVSFTGDTLFRSIIHFPENIPRGVYSTEVYLFSDGQLVGMQTTPLDVYKTGMDAFIYDIAHSQPVLYGIIAIGLALICGWGAGAIFRRVQG